jgi:flagellar basal body P-ring formation protein FlgA
MIPLAAFALAGCLAVGADRDQILAGDLAAAFPGWAAVPPETPLTLAPAPGVQRVIRVPELRKLAERFSLSPAPDREICFTRPVTVSTAERLLAAMQKEMPAALIELLDFSRQPAPEGDLAFPVSGLRQGPAGGYWSGYVLYAGKRRFGLWARVKVQVATARVVATQDLKPGLPLDAAQLRVETRQEVPALGFLSSLEEVSGKVSRRAIVAGAAFRAEWLEPAKVVLRGETVQVEVVRGGALLKLEGVAQASGAIGETIAIQNPTSKQRFPARVESKGRVVVTKGIL